MESIAVSQENLGQLKRKLTITVPLDQVKSAYDKSYAEIKGKIRVNGFRAGKMPQKMVEKRFQSMMSGEAMETLVPAAFEKAAAQESLKPATRPEFDNLNIDKNKPLEFTATFEIWPDFDLPAFSDIKIETIKVDITDEELETAKKVHFDKACTFEPKEGPAVDGDQVILDFEGTTEGGETASETAYAYELGTKQFLPEFEEAMQGMSAGEEKAFDVKLPDDHPNPEFQGKTTKFEIKINEVKVKVAPELNEAFFARFGEKVNSEEEFVTMVKDEITASKEFENKVEYRTNVKTQLESLLSFELPVQIWDEETNFRKQQLAAQQEQAPEGEAKTEEEIAETAKSEAEKSLRIAVYLQRLMEVEKIEVDEDAVRQRFTMNAQMMGMNPMELFQSDHGRKFYNDTYDMVVEETVLDFISEKALS